MKIRKLVALALGCTMAFSLSACGGAATTATTKAAAATTAKAAATTKAASAAATTKAAAATTAKAAATTAAGTKSASAESLANFSGKTLNISTFSFNADLLKKNIYDPFQKATGAKINAEGAKNAERLTKIQQNASAYDVVVISDQYAQQMKDKGLLEEVDYTKLSNYSKIYSVAQQPTGKGYGPAYTVTRLGIVYDSGTCPTKPASWGDLWSADLKGQISIPDITSTSGPLFYYATAKAFNLTPGKDDDKIFAKLGELKANVAKTYTSANDTITMLNQGEISVAVLLDYSYTTAKKANAKYVWVDPKEGTFASYNSLNIVKGSKNKEMAEAFINYYLSKEVQTAEAVDGVDAPIRSDVELTDAQKANFVYGQKMVDALTFPDWSVINGSLEKWTGKWNELFSVK
jgi:putative spermidine/putrescine transport system substrate-binding protein